MHSSSPVLRGALVAVAWLVATVLAGMVAWAAVSRLDRQGVAVAAQPLSPAQVAAQLGHTGQTSTLQDGPSPRSVAGTHAPGTTRLGTPQEDVSRSWQLAGGVVGVACRGRAAHLLYAAPLDGWAYRLESWRRVVSVEFTHAAQSAGLRAHCVGGVPARVAHDDREAPSGNGPSGD